MQHVKGAARIVELNGGPQKLGANGFLEHLLHKFVKNKRLLEADAGPPCGEGFMVR